MRGRVRSIGAESRTRPARRWSGSGAGTLDLAADPDKVRFVFAYTNPDVLELNAALRDVRKEHGALGEDHRITSSQRQTE